MMSDAIDDSDPGMAGEFSSPPCLMHRLEAAADGHVAAIDSRQRADVLRWRRAERQRLIELRLSIPASERLVLGERIARHLDQVLSDATGRIVGVYWPFRGEPDLRSWMEAVARRGGACALPVVVRRDAPLIFRRWRQGEPLQPGVWNIPMPSNGLAVTPDIVIAPVVGFDAARYRLGYGGGFFDRTLAGLPPASRFVGVGYGCQRIGTIYPQPHDVPMHVIVTEAGIIAD